MPAKPAVEDFADIAAKLKEIEQEKEAARASKDKDESPDHMQYLVDYESGFI